MEVKFIDREAEWRWLEEAYRAPGAQLLVLYGRRRIGKTALVERFVAEKGGIYHMCTYDYVERNVKELLAKLASYTGEGYLSRLEPRLDVFLEAYARFASRERIVLVLDEFQYLVEIDPAVPSLLQRAWDLSLSRTRAFILLVGSSVGMIEEKVLSRKSPLYGRRTGSWKMGEIPPGRLGEFLPGWGAEEVFKAWAVVGGVPYYLRLFDPAQSFEENLTRLFRKGGPLYEEPLFLLREELREPRVYIAILEAIAAGRNTLGEIADYAGVDKPKASKYLWVLQHLDIVRREVPLGAKRRGLYYVKDNLFRFWFRFVYPNISSLELGNDKPLRSAEALSQYFGEMLEEFVRRYSPAIFGVELKKYVKRDVDIDLAGEAGGCRIYGEVKWSADVDAEAVARELAWKKGGDVYVVVARGFRKRTPHSYTLEEVFDVLRGGRRIELCKS
ncbi:putative ATPase (AAA+ superfamily) [Pyrobaculum oguniense TE7]|uniref:ATPase (AAA+ superfamily) n=1 Tax=Pyrobaculum oguniense (strain DSM 13380 / JCM 10595 / TE7) TaxID=698757 RepID=H6Q9A6_PYROT|nr:putative ATPase (AAA+ superfamily) [Pyrobaculum oguniense TE7]